MFYCAIQGYANGNTSNIFRTTNLNGDVCGEGAAKDFPFTYFYQPITSTNFRYCVKSCPNSTTFPQCYPDCARVSWFTIPSSGALPTPVPGPQLLYDSQGLLDRICIPSTNTLTVAFQGVVDKISSASNTGTFGNFINDLKQVNLFINQELEMAFGSFWLLSHYFFHLDVRLEVSRWLYCLDFDSWTYLQYHWFGSYLHLQLRQISIVPNQLIRRVFGPSNCHLKRELRHLRIHLLEYCRRAVDCVALLLQQNQTRSCSM
jgi:hypothetical protein